MDWFPSRGGDSYLDGFLMKNFLRRLLVDEHGPTAVEYAVMLALIVIACISSVGLLSAATGESFDNSAAQINSALGS
jgi:pilus assembly protein Flp/PilA